MKILQVNTRDKRGGAEKIAWDLHEAYLKEGISSFLAVGEKLGGDPGVFQIPNDRFRSWWARFWLKVGNAFELQESNKSLSLKNILLWIGQPQRKFQIARGLEDFDFPATACLLELVPEKPDILHCHNLHGGYFDLRQLVGLSQAFPIVITMHDEWLLTGHCAYTLGCMRWEKGCGQCPDLTIYPPIRRDFTAKNYLRKQSIYRNSRLLIATPSQWLMNRVQASMLQPVETRLIPNGVDLNIFHPCSKEHARLALGLPQNVFILLTTGNRMKQNPFKDYYTIEKAVRLARLGDGEAIFISLGGDAGNEILGSVHVSHIGYTDDVAKVAQYYQAADVFLHAAHSDNFPTSILEALACGKPVIATAVGGVPEQIKDNWSGFLVSEGNAEMMAKYIELFGTDRSLQRSMGQNAAKDARSRFDRERFVDDYLNWYKSIQNDGNIRSL
jgi:glycosyltransferase involved in cell wall biosynthesis